MAVHPFAMAPSFEDSGAAFVVAEPTMVNVVVLFSRAGTGHLEDDAV